ncbi:MAG: tetratricopeptide repeat protein [Acidobacteriales bacterium]|nr:tetratricopeptide repeat protein [Terriglobales bacterium]
MFPSRFKRLRFPSLLLLACFLAPAALADNEWTEVRSPNFSVITDAGEKRGREVAQRFEQMRYLFGTLVSKKAINLPAPLQIIGFRNSKGFRQFAPLWKGKPVRAAGLYVPGEDANFILLDLSAYNAIEAVYHEYAHLLLNGNYPEAQPWFDEGFAEYFSSIKISSKRAELGGPPEFAGQTLRESPFFHIEDLFRVAHDSKVYNEDGDHRSMFYAQSWLVMHYLIEKGKWPQAGVYFDLVQNKKVPIAEAMERAFGLTPKQFDQEIRKYFAGNTVKGLWIEIPQFETALYKAEKLKPLDLQAVLADVHLHSPDYQEKAIAEFQAVLNSEPDHAAAHRGLGYAYLRKGDLSSAGEHFRRAAQLESNDARVHYYSALLMNRRALNEGGKVEQPDTMMAHLKRAIQIDPDLADAYNLLAFLQLTHGSPNEALESIKTALRLSPRNDYYYSTLAQAYMRQRKWDEAEAVLKRLESSEDPQVASIARENLQRVAEYRENVHLVEWADLRKRNEQKEWGTTPSAERLAEEAARPIEKEAAPTAPDVRPVKFVKGRLVNVACAENGRAVLTVTAGSAATNVASLKRRGVPQTPASAPAGKTFKLVVANAKKVVLVGVEEFACDWRNQRVAINYRAGGELDGEVMSLELQ